MDNKDPRPQTIELLEWATEQGYTPRSFKGKDRFLVPLTNEVKKLKDLMPHQRATALWLPKASRLGKRGLRAARVDIGELVEVELTENEEKYTGAGGTETEATLSALQAIRMRRGSAVAAL